MKKVSLTRDLCEVVYIASSDAFLYVDGKATNKLDYVKTAAYSKAGEIKIIFPPKEGLAEKLNEMFRFGQVLEVEAFFDIQDIQVSIYKEELSIKIYAELKEVEL